MVKESEKLTKLQEIGWIFRKSLTSEMHLEVIWCFGITQSPYWMTHS